MHDCNKKDKNKTNKTCASSSWDNKTTMIQKKVGVLV